MTSLSTLHSEPCHIDTTHLCIRCDYRTGTTADGRCTVCGWQKQTEKQAKKGKVTK